MRAKASPGLSRRVGRLLGWTVQAYFADHVQRLGAALAFYTTIAIAPLLVLAIGLAGIVFEQSEARERVMEQIQQLAGSQAVQAISSLEQPESHRTNVVATIIGSVTLVLGGLSAFAHLQDALNEIWRAKSVVEKHGWVVALKRRVFSFGIVVFTGFIMMVSLIVSAAVSWVATHRLFSHWPAAAAEVVNFVLPLAVITFLFATVFKLLPDAPVRWRHVWLGAAVTALLFNGGKYVLGLYLARSATISAYGVAGSVITLLLWSYYAAQIVLIGAEFTRIHTTTRGGREAPSS